jgi:magnesium transporter
MSAETQGVNAALRREYVRLYPREAARLLEDRPVEEIADVLASEPAPRAAAVFGSLSPETAARTLESLGDDAFRGLVATSDPDRLAPLLARFPPEERGRRLRLLPPALAGELRQILSYPPDSAGALMDPRATTFLPATRVDAALARLRARRERELGRVFLVDDDRRLVGSLALEDLAVAPPDRRLDELARGDPAAVAATATVEEVMERLQGVGQDLPVVDFEGRLVGVVRQGRLLAAAREEMGADVQAMVGASRDERALSPAVFAVRKRLPWLHVNLGTAFLAAAVVGLFEETIERITALAVLMPVVAGQAGNSGAQALAVTMRGLSLREVRPAQWRRLVAKELGVGLMNGLVIASVTSASVYFWSRSPGLTLVIGLAMVASMTIAGLSGAAVPVVLKAFGQDPAQASSILLTTVTDVAGFMSFLGLAALLARHIAPG